MKSLKRRTLASDPNAHTLASKVYVRSTRSGKVQKIVREIYLREDIPCSSRLCTVCLANAPLDSSGNGQYMLRERRSGLVLTFLVLATPFVLSEKPAGTKKFPKGHYIMPDTNALLSAMDLFEQANAFYDVIILQTVLEELKNRSLPLYNRLISLTKSEEKRFYLFFNEFRLETYVQRQDGESINDRNDRAVRTAAKWYEEHLTRDAKRFKTPKQIPAMVVLTDDKANLRKCQNEEVTALSLRDYVSGLEDAERLLDMISEANHIRGGTAGGQSFYAEHYTMSRMNTGITAGTLHQGVFNVSPYNYLEGLVHVPAFDKPLLILGRENSNRAIAGDVVVLEVLPKDQWKAPSSKILEEEALNKDDNPDTEETESVFTERERKALQEEVKKAHASSAESKAQPTAKVVGIMKRNWRQYVGHVDTSSSISQGRKQQTVFLVPMDKRIPKIRIRTRQASELLGKRILCTIDAWDHDSRYPVGHYVRDLGEMETKGAETEALLLEYDVQYRPFPKTVLDCLPSEGHDWRVPTNMDDPGWKQRKDLRDTLICSIDPPGCQDIDDALHAKPLPNGNYEVGVHIADVSHFVKPNNAMDTEASLRGTTVYLVDKRIDMLPMLLGTDLCSLKPYVERFAFSTIWEITPDAKIVSSSFTKSVIKSREAFSYEQAQIRIDDKKQQDDLTQGMRTLLKLSKLLRQQRMDAGALNLASPEVRIETDSETGDPLTDVKTKAMLETNSLVEEFMLLANCTVAAKIQTLFPQTAILRRHPTPPATSFEALAAQLLKKRGLTLDVSSSRTLADSLDLCVDDKNPFFNTLVRILATRCMTSAEYFSSGSHAEVDFRHYGLASPIYTHFTSPIRRYADLLVHRQLAAAIEYTGPGSGIYDQGLRSKGRLDAVVRNLNHRHRNAQLAGRASIEYYVGQALKQRGEKFGDEDKGVEEDGYVMRVFDNGVVVFVPRFGIEGTVRLNDFALTAKGESAEEDGGRIRESEFDDEEYALKVWEKGLEKNSTRVELFEKVRVRVKSEREEGGRGAGKRKVKITILKQ